MAYPAYVGGTCLRRSHPPPRGCLHAVQPRVAGVRARDRNDARGAAGLHRQCDSTVNTIWLSPMDAPALSLSVAST